MNIEETALLFAEWISINGYFRSKDGAWHRGTTNYYEVIANNTEELFKIYQENLSR